MGRSPLFDHIVQIQSSKDCLFNYQCLNVGNKVRFVCKKNKKDEDLDVIVTGVSRSCSTYGREECFLPKEEDSFIITRKMKYNFWRIWEYDPWNPYIDHTIENIFLLKNICKKFNLSDDLSSYLKSFFHVEYDFIDIEIEDDTQLTTFVIRSDGSILNIEDFSIRGYVEKILIQQEKEVLSCTT